MWRQKKINFKKYTYLEFYILRSVPRIEIIGKKRQRTSVFNNSNKQQSKQQQSTRATNIQEQKPTLRTDIIAAHATHLPTDFPTTEVGIATEECRGASFKALVFGGLNC